MTRGVLVWTGGVIAAGAVASLVVYFVAAGFHPTDTIGVIGAVVGIAGLVLAVAGLLTGGRGGQSVAGSGVGGGVAQVRGGKNVKIHRRVQVLGAGASPPLAPGGQQPPPAAAGQSVAGSQVAGPVGQVDGARGDVELREEP